MTAVHQQVGWINSPPQRLLRRRCSPANPLARLLMLHGYGDHSGRYGEVMAWLAERGIATESFDFRGHGKSSGKRGFVRRWSEFLDDLRAVLAQIAVERRAAGQTEPLMLLGHSHGGLVAAAAGVDGLLSAAGVTGVILSAPYLRPHSPLTPLWNGIAKTTNLLTPALRVPSGLTPEMMTSDPAMIEDSRQDRLLLRSATPRWYSTTLRRQQQVMAHAADFRLPLLCMIGDADPIADAAAVQRFAEHAGSSDRTFVLLPGQKHEILREVERHKTFERIRQWVGERAGRSQRGVAIATGTA